MSGPLLEKYQKAFNDNPSSRVFAPLAEAYRKSGMPEKALQILKEGIKLHPHYPMGYLGVASCYADLNQWSLVHSTLKPFVEKSRDNLRLQNLYARSCEELSIFEEALETYKFLLFLNPKNEEIAKKVKLLEEKETEDGEELSLNTKQKNNNSLFKVDEIKIFSDADEWEKVDWQKETTGESSNDEESFDMGQWVLEPPTGLEKKVISEFKKEESSSPPFATHTLVDLYCEQGHPDKALEILNKIIELNPKDKRTLEKIEEVQSLVVSVDENLEEEKEDIVSNLEVDVPAFDHLEESGNLMDFYDRKMGESRQEQISSLEKTLWLFHDKLKAKSREIAGYK